MFIVTVIAVLGLVQLYLWKRLVKDTTRRGRTRTILTTVLIGLTALLVATLILPRKIGVTESSWFAWPGYVWFALAVYLFLALLVLEPVRLVLSRWIRRSRAQAVAAADADPLAADRSAADVSRRLFLSREGSFFVTGNHGYFVDDTADWLRELERFGVHPLRNENTAIRRGGAAFHLAGVNDIAGKSHGEPPDFDRALSGLDSSRPTVLLAHQPVLVAQAAEHGVDLQLSGHAHGGQMWPFHYIVRAVQPSLAGLSTVDGTQLYVSRGAGFWGPPVRVGAAPDITVISLQAKP